MQLNTLIIDENSSAVNYKHAKIDNNIPLLKINDLYELNNISKHANLHSVDSSDCLTLILDENISIAYHQYKHDREVRFIKLSHKKLCNKNNDIIFPVNISDYIKNNLAWSKPFQYKIIDDNVSEHERDINGYNNTQLILKFYKKHTNTLHLHAQVFDYIKNTYMQISGPAIYQSYMPAWRQMLIIYDCRHLINNILADLNKSSISFENIDWMTSTESSSWLIKSIKNGCTYNWDKAINAAGLFPLFKEINGPAIYKYL